MWRKANELKPVFDEITRRAAGMSDQERRAWIDNALGDPAVALDILNSCAERILGRPVEEGTVITWPAELVEAVPGFMVQVLEEIDIKELVTDVLQECWARHEGLQKIWPDKEEYLGHCVPEFLRVIEKDVFNEDEALEEVFILPALKQDLRRIRETSEGIRRAWPDEEEYFSSCLHRALEVFCSGKARLYPTKALHYILFGQEQGSPA